MIQVGVNRALRLMGNYTPFDFDVITRAADDAEFAIANLNTKNAPYIMFNGPGGWRDYSGDNVPGETAGEIVFDVKEEWDIDVEENEWFTLDYTTDGSRAHGGFDADNMPSPTAEGPFYFGVGIPGQGYAHTYLVKDVKLIGIAGPDTVFGQPAYFEGSEGAIPAFVGYDTPTGNGIEDANREIVDEYDFDEYVPPPPPDADPGPPVEIVVNTHDNWDGDVEGLVFTPDGAHFGNYSGLFTIDLPAELDLAAYTTVTLIAEVLKGDDTVAVSDPTTGTFPLYIELKYKGQDFNGGYNATGILDGDDYGAYWTLPDAVRTATGAGATTIGFANKGGADTVAKVIIYSILFEHEDYED